MQFFNDFSGYRHARAKISTVLESAHQDGSKDTNKPYICDNFFFDLIRGALKTLGAFLKSQIDFFRNFFFSYCKYIY